MAKRMRVEIVADILDGCRKESSRTAIMYHCNLSFESTTKYLAWLTLIELLWKEPSTRKYQITTKGKRFLTCWSDTSRLLQVENQNESKWMMPQAEQSLSAAKFYSQTEIQSG